MEDWVSITRGTRIAAVAGMLLVAVSSVLAVFGGAHGGLPLEAGQAGLVAAYAGAIGVTLWAALRHRTRSHRRAWSLVAAGLAAATVSYAMSLDVSSASGTSDTPGSLMMAVLFASFVLLGSGLIMLASGMRRFPGAGRVLTASVLLALVVALLVGVASFAPVGASHPGLRQADWGPLLLVCFDTSLLLIPALFCMFAAFRTASMDSRACLCLVAAALIMILGDALYPLVTQSGESVLASVPWTMAVVLFAVGASLSADGAAADAPATG